MMVSIDRLSDAFRAGVAAAKEAIKKEIVDMYEAWDQAGTDERCDYVDGVKVPAPKELT